MAAVALSSLSHGAGCGCKLPAQELLDIVRTLPAEPLLEIVNVPPLISSGPSLRLRARAARSRRCRW